MTDSNLGSALPLRSIILSRRECWTTSVIVAICCLFTHSSLAQQVADTGDQIWLVSTRQASSADPSIRQTSRIRYWSYQGHVGWQPAGGDDFFQAMNSDGSATPLPVCIYVHENRMTASEAFSRALEVWSRMREASPGSRFRLVVISWPSDRIGIRPRPDAQIKAWRSEMHAFYLAWLLDRIDPQVPISLFGHSYGPRLISAALHLLGGGTIEGRRPFPRVHLDRSPMQVVLLAAALNADSLLPGHCFGRALTQVERLMITINPCDPVLHWYPRMYGCRGPQALGYVGLPTSGLGTADRQKVQQINVGRIVGKSHSWRDYEGSAPMMSRIIPDLLPQSSRFHQTSTAYQSGTMNASAVRLPAPSSKITAQ